MKRDLPPLLALRAFEAAGRHLSFTRAAEELNVTQSAISRHVKLLESYLRRPVFQRLTRRIEFTSFGRSYFLAISAGLEAIERAAPVATSERTTLKVSISQSLGNLWLLPRLASFTNNNQDIEVLVDMSMQPVDFERDDTNVAIRLGRLPGSHYDRMQPEIPFSMVKSWNGVIAEHLFDEVLTPVLHRRLLATGRPIKIPRDLLQYSLIETTLRPEAWQDWFRTKGITRLPKVLRIRCGHFSIALNEAYKQRGVALVPAFIIDNFPSNNSLVRPFRRCVKSAGGCYLLYRESEANNVTIRRFRKWLFANR